MNCPVCGLTHEEHNDEWCYMRWSAPEYIRNAGWDWDDIGQTKYIEGAPVLVHLVYTDASYCTDGFWYDARDKCACCGQMRICKPVLVAPSWMKMFCADCIEEAGAEKDENGFWAMAQSVSEGL